MWSRKAALCHLTEECPAWIAPNLPVIAESALADAGIDLLPVPRVSMGELPEEPFHHCGQACDPPPFASVLLRLSGDLSVDPLEALAACAKVEWGAMLTLAEAVTWS